MADQDDSMNEEQWLYGDSSVSLPTSDIKKEQAAEIDSEAPPGTEPLPLEVQSTEVQQNDAAEPGEILNNEEPADGNKPDDSTAQNEGEEGQEEEDEDEEDDDSEDDVHVTIGDIKTAPQYPNLNIKRGAQLASGIDKINKQQQGKFSIEEFESIGTINGLPAHEFSIDALEDKPWRKPGADITDYFNYGFNEDTWRAYCERQKQMRVHESGVGLGGLGVARVNPALTVVNENSKYAGAGSTVLVGGAPPPGVGPRKAGPPPSVRRSGVIDVIGSVNSRRAGDSPPKENTIQVMTGDRRDYRKGFDLSVPPPGFEAPPPMPMVTSYPPHSGYNQDFYPPEMDPYYQAYEPTQEMQWGGGQMLSQVWSSRHREKKSSHSSHSLDHPKRSKYLHGNPMMKDPDLSAPGSGSIIIKTEPPEKSLKERERDRESRHKESRHRHRSRSRSTDRSERRRKHKSRSRSPGHRSHKKKKSKKSERKDSSD